MKKVLLVAGANRHKPDSIGSAISYYSKKSHEIRSWTFSDGMGALSRLIRENDYLAEDVSLVVSIGKMGNQPIGEDDHTREMIEANLTLPMDVVNRFVRALDRPPTSSSQQPRSKIIIIGSMAATKPLTNMSAYCSAKAGLDMFARCAAYELAPKGIDVFMINPGTVSDTPMRRVSRSLLVQERGMTPEEATKYLTSGERAGRNVSATEIASLVRYLLGDQSQFLSGSSINLPGGSR